LRLFRYPLVPLLAVTTAKVLPKDLSCLAIPKFVTTVATHLPIEPTIKRGLVLLMQVRLTLAPIHLPLNSLSQKKTPIMVPTLVGQVVVQLSQVIMVSYLGL